MNITSCNPLANRALKAGVSLGMNIVIGSQVEETGLRSSENFREE
jgi:hypothetical protein